MVNFFTSLWRKMFPIIHALLYKAPFILDQGVSTLASATIASLSAAKAWQKSSESSQNP